MTIDALYPIRKIRTAGSIGLAAGKGIIQAIEQKRQNLQKKIHRPAAEAEDEYEAKRPHIIENLVHAKLAEATITEVLDSLGYPAETNITRWSSNVWDGREHTDNQPIKFRDSFDIPDTSFECECIIEETPVPQSDQPKSYEEMFTFTIKDTNPLNTMPSITFRQKRMHTINTPTENQKPDPTAGSDIFANNLASLDLITSSQPTSFVEVEIRDTDFQGYVTLAKQADSEGVIGLVPIEDPQKLKRFGKAEGRDGTKSLFGRSPLHTDIQAFAKIYQNKPLDFASVIMNKNIKSQPYDTLDAKSSLAMAVEVGLVKKIEPNETFINNLTQVFLKKNWYTGGEYSGGVMGKSWSSSKDMAKIVWEAASPQQLNLPDEALSQLTNDIWHLGGIIPHNLEINRMELYKIKRRDKEIDLVKKRNLSSTFIGLHQDESSTVEINNCKLEIGVGFRIRGETKNRGERHGTLAIRCSPKEDNTAKRSFTYFVETINDVPKSQGIIFDDTLVRLQINSPNADQSPMQFNDEDPRSVLNGVDFYNFQEKVMKYFRSQIGTEPTGL